jgi:hypothetical protein
MTRKPIQFAVVRECNSATRQSACGVLKYWFWMGLRACEEDAKHIPDRLVRCLSPTPAFSDAFLKTASQDKLSVTQTDNEPYNNPIPCIGNELKNESCSICS